MSMLQLMFPINCCGSRLKSSKAYTCGGTSTFCAVCSQRYQNQFSQVLFDTDIDGDKQDRLTLGLNFCPTEDMVLKLDYQYN